MTTKAAKTYATKLARHIDRHTSVDARRAARDAAGLPRCDRRPVYVIPGASAPTRKGAGFYFTTPSGKTIVRHPKAYGYRTLYHCSTRRVEVGARWLAVRGLAFTGPVSL